MYLERQQLFITRSFTKSNVRRHRSTPEHVAWEAVPCTLAASKAPAAFSRSCSARGRPASSS
eukprot:scaffold7457_cov62-Phaeocystis_antarctica.AAC.1